MPAPLIYSTTGSVLTAEEIAFAQQVAASFAMDMRRQWIKLVRREDPATGAVVEYHGYKDIAYVTPGGGIVGHSGGTAVKWGLRSNTPSELTTYPGSSFSGASGISKGSTIVGSANVGAQTIPVMWSGITAVENLGVPSGFTGSAVATGVSDNGRVVSIRLLPTDLFSAAGRWTRETGVNYLPVLPTTDESEATSVSGDGSVIVGYIRDSGIGDPSPSSTVYQVAVYWDSSGGIHYVYPLVYGGSTSSFAMAASKDGSVIVGVVSTPTAGIKGFRWTAATGPMSLGESPFGALPAVRPLAVSDDGSVVVGSIDNPTTDESNAFRWTAETGVVDLGYLNIGDTNSVATGVSSDGETIVGVSGSKAFKWTATTGMTELLPLPGVTASTFASDIS